jgi:hypothetical protein
MLAERNRINRNLNSAISGLRRSIDSLANLKNSGISFEGHAMTWIEMVETVSRHLGDIHNILIGLWGQIIEDPALYKELILAEWTTVIRESREVLGILDVGTQPQAVSTPNPRPRRAIKQTISVAANEKAEFMAAVSPPPKLGSQIRKDATAAREVFTAIDQLLTMPFSKEIIGNWEDDETVRKTLFDRVTELRTEYVQMMGTEYNVMQDIYNLSILQEFRAQSVANKVLSVDLFISNSLSSVKAALAAAKRTSDRFGDTADEFAKIMAAIDKNISELEKKIDGLDTDISKWTQVSLIPTIYNSLA